MDARSKLVVVSERPKIAARHDNDPRSTPKPRDWAESLATVQRAAQTMRAAEERTQTVIARAEAALELAARELDEAHRRSAAAEELWRDTDARARRAEAQLEEMRTRLAAAEARADEAESWLDRIHQSIVSEFPEAISHGSERGGLAPVQRPGMVVNAGPRKD